MSQEERQRQKEAESYRHRHYDVQTKYNEMETDIIYGEADRQIKL